MKLKALMIGILSSLALCIPMGANAETPVDITLNNEYLSAGRSSYIDNGTTLVPVRAIANALGCENTQWVDSQKKVELTNGNDFIEIYIGKSKAYINGEEKTLQKTAKLIGNKAYVNVRFLADALGADISWIGKTHTVALKKDGHSVNSTHIDNSYTSDDLDWLAKIVHAEAQGEAHDGKVAVANVVLNRKKSNLFPNNIYDVVFDTDYGVQFTPVANGTIYNNPSTESYHAAKQALFGKNVAGNALYFCNPKISTNFWITNNRKFLKSIGNHDFYL